MQRIFGSGKVLQLVLGDITKVPVDAICNAANSELRGGGGVDGAIHRVGGPAILQELDKIRAAQGSAPPGTAVATTAGSLPAKYVFHAVGPIYRDGQSGERETLASAYRSCLALAEEKQVQYVSFPSISTGIYGYPVAEAAAVALGTVSEHLEHECQVQHVVFVLFDASTLAAYRDALSGLGRA